MLRQIGYHSVVLLGEILIAAQRVRAGNVGRGAEVVRVSLQAVGHHPDGGGEQQPILLRDLDAQRLGALAATERHDAHIDRGELAHREEVAVEARRAAAAAARHRGAQGNRREVSAVRTPHRPLRRQLGAVATGLARDTLSMRVSARKSAMPTPPT